MSTTTRDDLDRLIFGPIRPPAIQTPRPPAPKITNKTTSGKPKRILEIEAHLESIHELAVKAINERDFDRKSEAWQHFADTVEVETDVLHEGERSTSTSLEVYLARQKMWSELRPDIKITCVRSFKVDDRAGRAKCTSFSQLTGNFPGIVSVSAGCTDFRLADSKWLVQGIYTQIGIDLLCFDGM